jgi:hypothetical protein
MRIFEKAKDIWWMFSSVEKGLIAVICGLTLYMLVS